MGADHHGGKYQGRVTGARILLTADGIDGDAVLPDVLGDGLIAKSYSSE
jgi:hypothetical protein